MRNRIIQLNIRLTPNEYNKVIRNSNKTSLTVSGYIRMLIDGYVPKETPPIEYHELIKQLAMLNAKLPKNNTVITTELSAVILHLQESVTQPERAECTD